MSLTEFSLSYYGDNDIYARFSQCEDYPHMVSPILLHHTFEQKVLDAGCGTGKYINLLKKQAASVTGVDQSVHQLKITQSRNPEVPLICADLSKLPLGSDKFDVCISTWVLGTILDTEKRLRALNYLKSTCSKIILVENAPGSEFEYIRGRLSDSRTLAYNHWLCENGFILHHELDSYFSFKDLTEARNIFGTIWNPSVANQIVSPIIKHDISIYIWTK